MSKKKKKVDTEVAHELFETKSKYNLFVFQEFSFLLTNFDRKKFHFTMRLMILGTPTSE